MSHATLAVLEYGDKTAWEHDSRLSLAGTTDTALPLFLNQHRAVKEIVLCLDNDQAGREAAAQIAQKYALKGYTVLNQPPRGKDHNEDLQALTAQIRAERSTKSARRDVEI
jgi:DNA primase